MERVGKWVRVGNEMGGNRLDMNLDHTFKDEPHWARPIPQALCTPKFRVLNKKTPSREQPSLSAGFIFKNGCFS